MDPLVIASNQRPIVFFMTRSDVFTTLLKPILWAAHMLPIYRMQDGEDTKAKNEEVFAKCNRILKFGRSLLIFSEGFTDDVFVRRLKPIKKGAVRIGFGALEYMNWKKKVYIQPLGVNYADPNVLGSDVVISNGERICLNDFRAEYEENPFKVVNDLTKRVELEMQAQLTDVRNIDWTDFHEQVMRLTKKGMNAVDSDKSIPLLKRWEYSKQLADWMNNLELDSEEELKGLKNRLQNYFDKLDKEGVSENELTTLHEGQFRPLNDIVFFIFTFPLMVVGLLHHYVPYIWVKSFVEKSFKRSVFWGSVKMLLGTLVVGIFNIVLISVINIFVFPAFWFWVIYFFSVPVLTGVVAYSYFKRMSRFRRMKVLKDKEFSNLYSERESCIEEIKRLIPVA
jgi:1-acyl-sn-glycerol-3-phosphate acyltransferase